MGNSEGVKITSIDDFFKEVRKLYENKIDVDFIFRGQADLDWGLDTSAARRIHKFSGIDDIPNNLFINYHEQLINDAKLKGYHRKSEIELNDLELTAELQHYSAATCLLDFTRNAAVGLWFACYEKPKKDGTVYILEISNPEKFNQVNFLDIKEKKIRDFLTPDLNKLWYWEPSEINHRIPKQHSIFVFGQPKLDEKISYKIIIDKRYKKTILENLKKIYNIDIKSLFSDLSGFARANNVQIPYTEWKSEDYLIHGNYSMQRGEFENAIDYYNKAIEKNPVYAEAYNNRGYAKSKLGRYNDAIPDYDKAIEKNPTYNDAYNNRGNTKLILGRYEEAISDFTKVIEIEPSFIEAYNSRGFVKLILGRYEEAISDFNKAIEINPSFASAYYYRGSTKSELGRYEEAISDFNKAIEINPSFASAYDGRGSTKSELGRYEEAISDFNKAIEINPSFASAYNNRGYAKCKLGKYKEALPDFNKAIAIDPSFASAYNGRGYAKSKLGRYEDALPDYKQAIGNNPYYAEAYKNMSYAKSKLGRYDEAKLDFERYNELINVE